MAQLQRVRFVSMNRFQFASVFSDDIGARLKMEREISHTLTKLQRLSALMPKEDPRTARALIDHTELKDKFQKVVFAEDQLDESETEELNTIKRRNIELQTKKLMTVCKSKYYMLKVNFPKQAEMIDNDPIIDET